MRGLLFCSTVSAKKKQLIDKSIDRNREMEETNFEQKNN